MYKKKPVKKSSGAKPWLIVGGVLLGVIGSGWLAFGYFRGDELAAVTALREQLRDESLSPEQRREIYGQMREEYEKLSPDTRRDLWQSREQARNHEMQNQLTQFFNLTPAEREKELDKQIDESEKRRKEREKERAQRDRERGDRGNREASGNGGGNGGGGGGRGDRGSQTSTDRLARQKQRLNSTTPELRAMRSDYFRMLSERRQARGLPPWRGRG